MDDISERNDIGFTNADIFETALVLMPLPNDEALMQKQGWQKASENLPDSEDENDKAEIYEIAVRGFDKSTIAYFDGCRFYVCNHSKRMYFEDVTYWRQVPKVPEKKDEEMVKNDEQNEEEY